MRRIAKVFVGKALTWIARCAPKKEIFVLRGFPSFEDNLIAIYEALLERGVSRIVWVVNGDVPQPPIRIGPQTEFVRKGSWRDYYYSFVARYIFITHGHFLKNIPPNQFCINLWHGIPYKAIGKLDGDEGRSDTFVIATSELTKDIFARSFGVSPAKVAITGQARTDRLLLRDQGLLRRRIFPILDSDTKILLWLPTYRETTYGAGRVDGMHFENDFNCSDFDEVQFSKYLAQHNSVCFIKAHPMAVSRQSKQYHNLVHIEDKWLLENEITLYQLCGLADCLISDISSVIIDFMLLDRPIVLLFEDIEEYQISRGYSFNPIADWLPGPVAKNFSEFSAEVAAVIDGEDRHRAKRQSLRREFFSHDCGGASMRILDLMLGTCETSRVTMPTSVSVDHGRLKR